MLYSSQLQAFWFLHAVVICIASHFNMLLMATKLEFWALSDRQPWASTQTIYNVAINPSKTSTGHSQRSTMQLLTTKLTFHRAPPWEPKASQHASLRLRDATTALAEGADTQSHNNDDDNDNNRSRSSKSPASFPFLHRNITLSDQIAEIKYTILQKEF